MKPLDRLLQRWRIKQAATFIPQGARLLDIGCADGALYRILKPKLQSYVGLDPTLPGSVNEGNCQFIAGSFPEDFPSLPAFDVITMLAVIEHLPREMQDRAAEACVECLSPDGILILSTPSPSVNRLLWILRGMRVIDGMSLDEHYGFEPKQVPKVFHHRELDFIHHQSFELGLNHLFVFRKKSGTREFDHEM